MVTGTAMGDLQGYTLTLTANETTLPNFVDSTSADPFAGMTGLTTEAASTKRTP